MGPEFLASTQDAIWESALFRRVLKDPAADYELEVRLVELKTPAGDFNTDITISVSSNWILYESQSRAVVMNKLIKSTYKADMQWQHLAYAAIPVIGMSMGEDYGVRHKRAIDGAMRDNIVQGLTSISELRLN